MADEWDEKEVAGKEEKQQPMGGQQSHKNEYGEQGQPIGGNDSETGSGAPLGEGAEPPGSTGTSDTEFGQMSDDERSGQQGQGGTGQADLGSQSDTTPAGHTDQQDPDLDQTAQVASATGSGAQQGEGFILQENSDAPNEEDESGEGPRDVGSGDPGSSV